MIHVVCHARGEGGGGKGPTYSKYLFCLVTVNLMVNVVV
jgi:hypothetical protein